MNLSDGQRKEPRDMGIMTFSATALGSAMARISYWETGP